MNRKIVVTVLVLVGALLGGAIGLLTLGGDSSPPQAEASTVFISRVGAVGPDSFTRSFATGQLSEDYPYDLTEGEIAADSEGLYAAPRGTYGGPGSNVCDIAGMIAFFEANPDRAREWARVQRIATSEIPDFLASLTPAFLTQNVELTMFGFKNGAAYGYTAVLEKGTAVLLNNDGLPVVRCACGNPLIADPELRTPPPEEVPEITTEEVPGEVPGDDPGDEPGDEPGDDPGDEPGDDPGDEPGDEPGDDPGDECEEEPCDEPRITTYDCDTVGPPAPGATTTDRFGTTWTYTGAEWHDGAGTTVVNAASIPGFIDGCDPCPPLTKPSNGSAWTSTSGETWTYADGAWTNDDGDTYRNLYDVPAYRDDCLPCPPEDPTDGDSWTDPWNRVWVWTPNGWYNEATGESVYSSGKLPGVPDDCLPVECPPDEVYDGYRWTDAEGNEWEYVGPGWRDVDDPENYVLSIVYMPGGEDCLECPPIDPVEGDTYVNRMGMRWVYTGDAWHAPEYGFTTTSIDLVTMGDVACSPCPPAYGIDIDNDGVPERSTLLEPLDGDVWADPVTGEMWDYTAGQWVSRDSGDAVAELRNIPGWQEFCNPCPTVGGNNSVSVYYGSRPHWIDINSDLWLQWDPTGWLNISAFQDLPDAEKQSIFDSGVWPTAPLYEIPGYTDLCDPCPPGSEYARDALGRPINDESDVAGDTTDEEGPIKTVEITEKGTPDIAEADDEYVERWTPNDEDCDPCPPEQPTVGTVWIDPYDGRWTWNGDLWQLETSPTYSVYSPTEDLPGYTDLCDPCEPGDEQVDENCEPYQDCPPEQPRNGDRVIDADGVLWTYVDYHWVSESGEDYRYTVNEFEGCNPCPPLYLRVPSVMTIGALSFGSTPLQGTVLEGEAPTVSYIDSYGVRWDYQGGEWVPSDPDQEPTSNIWDIPGMSQDCPIPDCPPNGDLALGTAFIAPSGEVWTLYQAGWFSSSGNFAATFGDIAECATPGEINVKIYVDCGQADGPGIIVRVNLSGDADAIVSVTDSVDPSREYAEGAGYWFAIWDTGADRPVVFTATLTDGSEVTTTETITAEDCGVPTDDTPPEEDTPDYAVDIKEVTCSYDVKNNQVVLLVSLSGDFEQVSGVTDNDTPPNTYIQSATRANEWRTAIAADDATGTITITVTYNGGSDTYDVTLSDTFCDVPTEDTPPDTTTPTVPEYNVEVDPDCEYDIEMREYTLTALISGDLDGIERVYDSLATSTSYSGPVDGTYSRVIDEDIDGEIPTQSVSFTVLMDNGETFSSSLDISPTNCGKQYYPYIDAAKCGYNTNTGWAYLELVIGGDQYELAAVGSVTDSVGGAKAPFVKINDTTWRTDQWMTDEYTYEFTGALKAGLNGRVGDLPIDSLYQLGDCDYQSPSSITFECAPTPDNNYLVKMTIGTVQIGASVVAVDDANGTVGQAPGHAEFTEWVVDQNNSNVWTAVLTRPELTSRSGPTYFTVTDSRGKTGGRNQELLTLCEGN
ncbi:MAG: hypothetical protein O2982_04145 [Actinomycetota bacterium]|nr:hypothetical protein [Actinomycetota bacterium]